MTSMGADARVLHLAGLGLPRIDFITPSLAEFDAGKALIAATALTADAPTELQAARADGPTHIAAAKEALLAFKAFFDHHRFAKGNGKADLTREQAEAVVGWFAIMRQAARDINALANYAGRRDARLLVRFMGGSMLNKLHTIKAVLGDEATVRLFGALGAEDASGNRARILKELAASGIDFRALEVGGEPLVLDSVLATYVVATAEDRVALKAPLPERMVARFTAAIPHIAALAAAPEIDGYLIEGGDIGDRKFGQAAFFAFADAAMASGKPIAFAVPTDTQLVLGGSPAITAIRDAMFRLMRHRETTIIACNDSEAVAMFCNDSSLSRLPEALALIRDLLQEKRRQHVKDDGETVAFVSAGKAGSYAITAEYIHFSPAPEAARFVGSIGAGDAFFAGCYVAHLRLRSVRKFSADDLQAMLALGQRIAAEVVGYKGAQLPPAKIAALLA